MARQLQAVARDHHRAHPEGPAEAKLRTWLGALVPRVMYPGSWAEAARHAGAEPLWTGRARVYDASTLRQVAARLDAEGCAERVAAAVWEQVDTAVRAADEEVLAYTDLFDQPYYTKKLAHAAPIGRLGNRLLAATYFGLTTVALPQGPTLFAHLSWHKPAAPLRDALEHLFADDVRLDWWHAHVRLHIVDRGANGDPVLGWLWACEVPYLTIGRKRADLWRFRAPTERTSRGQPLVVRPDPRLDGTAADGPWELVVPAHPEDPNERHGLRFRSAVALTGDDLAGLNVLYKSRWPSMENELKALVSRGFDRNRTRAPKLTTSRGVDGALARQQEREETLLAQLSALREEPPSGANLRQVLKTVGQVHSVRAAQARIEAAATPKYARPEGGSERLGKWLHLLTHNALALALYGSSDEEVRTMSPAMAFDLLLGQSALTRLAPGRLTLWVEVVGSAADRRHQANLIEVLNNLRLQSRGCLIEIRLRETGVGKDC